RLEALDAADTGVGGGIGEEGDDLGLVGLVGGWSSAGHGTPPSRDGPVLSALSARGAKAAVDGDQPIAAAACCGSPPRPAGPASATAALGAPWRQRTRPARIQLQGERPCRSRC